MPAAAARHLVPGLQRLPVRACGGGGRDPCRGRECGRDTCRPLGFAGGAGAGGPHHYCNSVEAPWLVNGGHGASLRHHNDLWCRGRWANACLACWRSSPVGGGSHSRQILMLAAWRYFKCCSHRLSSRHCAASVSKLCMRTMVKGESDRSKYIIVTDKNRGFMAANCDFGVYPP
jgi:hypothetical protein